MFLIAATKRTNTDIGWSKTKFFVRSVILTLLIFYYSADSKYNITVIQQLSIFVAEVLFAYIRMGTNYNVNIYRKNT